MDNRYKSDKLCEIDEKSSCKEEKVKIFIFKLGKDMET